MSRNTFSTWLIIVLLAFAGAIEAKVTAVPFDELHPSRQHRQSALIITKVVDRFHYRKLELDDALAADIFDRYLEALDPNKSFFTAADIERFAEVRTGFDDALRTARIEPAFDIFKHFRTRVNERISRALTMLEAEPFDFNRSEVYMFDRDEAPWAADEAALDEVWRRRIKNDILSLEVAGKEPQAARETVRKRYEGTARRVNQLTADDVFQTFINAYTLSIEPHTSYMSPRSSENFDISMRLSLQGIGAVLRSENEYTLVQNTVPGGPAERSGEIRAGDRIVGVGQGEDGSVEDVIGWRLQDVVELIRGPKGSVVRLNVLPKTSGPEGRYREVVLVRDEIKLEDQAAKSEIIEGLPGMEGRRIGVIEIPAFYRDFRAQAAGEDDFRSTTRDVRRLLAELAGAGVDGVVIDLRGNGGGSLTEATELTGLFIPEGAVVQVRDSGGRIDVEVDPDPEQVYKGPLAVLVDRNSASASEIFAGAIQDYRRGIVIGEPTFGKGTVQTLVDLSRFVQGEGDLGRLRLTMAQFFRINGGSTQHRGVMPDIVFPTASSADDHGERSLENALPWARIESVSYKTMSDVPLDALRTEHTRRIARDPGFLYLIEQEQDLTALRERDTVSLALAVRQQEWRQRDQQRLERRNRLRAYRGLEPLAANGDEDEEEAAARSDEDDPEGVSRIMVEESARILADYIRLSRPMTAQLR
jgi:carboxyl-terminal processing protease